MFRRWARLGLESKFHETGTFGGFGKRAQCVSDIQRIFNTGHIIWENTGSSFIENILFEIGKPVNR